MKRLIGWAKHGKLLQDADLAEVIGYHVEDYFRDGQYLGPDQDGIEPIFDAEDDGVAGELHVTIDKLRAENNTLRASLKLAQAHKRELLRAIEALLSWEKLMGGFPAAAWRRAEVAASHSREDN